MGYQEISTEVIQEGIIQSQSPTEVRWVESEIKALRGFVQSLIDRQFLVRRESFRLMKHILKFTKVLEVAEEMNREAVPSDEYEKLQKLLVALQKRVEVYQIEITTMNADLRLFERQLRHFQRIADDHQNQNLKTLVG